MIIMKLIKVILTDLESALFTDKTGPDVLSAKTWKTDATLLDNVLKLLEEEGMIKGINGESGYIKHSNTHITLKGLKYLHNDDLIKSIELY